MNPVLVAVQRTTTPSSPAPSYPQIIHEPSWNATGGVITCSEFVDINGKRHADWIPAIKLWSD